MGRSERVMVYITSVSASRIASSVHLYAGLFLSPLVIVFAVSVFVINHAPMPSRAQETRRVAAGLDVPAGVEALEGRATNVIQPDFVNTFTEYYANSLPKKTWNGRTYPVQYAYDAQGRRREADPLHARFVELWGNADVALPEVAAARARLAAPR